LAARRLGAVGFEPLPRLALVPDDRTAPRPRIRSDRVGSPLRAVPGEPSGAARGRGPGAAPRMTAGAREAAGLLAPGRSRVRAVAAALRPTQWIKNAALLAAPIFAQKVTHPESLLPVLLGIAAFSALASAGYLANDI